MTANAVSRPMIERFCRECGGRFEVKVPSDKKVFCVQACAARFNNRGRIQKPETRDKRSNALKAYHAANPATAIMVAAKQKRRPDVTHIRRAECTCCGTPFWSHRACRIKADYTRLCSDKCFLATKRGNASGIKRTIYRGMLFDSGWEAELAMHLDRIGIPWIVPEKAIKWIDCRGKSRRYYPDFFVPDLHTYLDPKNPFVAQRQSEKLDAVKGMIHLIYGSPSDIMDVLTDRWATHLTSL